MFVGKAPTVYQELDRAVSAGLTPKNRRVTYGAQNIILMTKMDEKLNLIKLKNWASRIING